VTDYAPVAGHPASISARAGATIIGGRLVRLAVPALFPGQVEPTAAVGDAGNSRVLGVAGNDARPDGSIGPDPVTVLTGVGVIHEGTATAAIATGALLFATTGGQVTATGPGTQVGFAVAASVPGWLPGSNPATDPPDFHRVRWLPSRVVA
jgi:hypothetical protein